MGCYTKTGDQTYVAYGLWESEEKMQSAMPEMISLLDRSRHLLEELSSAVLLILCQDQWCLKLYFLLAGSFK